LFGGDDLAEVGAQSADGGASPSIKASIGVSEAREGFLVEREGLLGAIKGAMERTPCGEGKAVKLLLLLAFGEEVEGFLEVLRELGVLWIFFEQKQGGVKVGKGESEGILLLGLEFEGLFVKGLGFGKTVLCAVEVSEVVKGDGEALGIVECFVESAGLHLHSFGFVGLSEQEEEISELSEGDGFAASVATRTMKRERSAVVSFGLGESALSGVDVGEVVEGDAFADAIFPSAVEREGQIVDVDGFVVSALETIEVSELSEGDGFAVAIGVLALKGKGFEVVGFGFFEGAVLSEERAEIVVGVGEQVGVLFALLEEQECRTEGEFGFFALSALCEEMPLGEAGLGFFEGVEVLDGLCDGGV